MEESTSLRMPTMRAPPHSTPRQRTVMEELASASAHPSRVDGLVAADAVALGRVRQSWLLVSGGALGLDEVPHAHAVPVTHKTPPPLIRL
jgi:hypothetical protein